MKITSQQVALLTQSNERYGRKIINKVKSKLNKNKEQFITRWEFADYMKISREELEYNLTKK